MGNCRANDLVFFNKVKAKKKKEKKNIQTKRPERVLVNCSVWDLNPDSNKQEESRE